MDATKLLFSLNKGGGSMLTPHLDLYLSRGEFPDKWDIEIRNFKADDGHYHPSSHAKMDPRQLYFDRLGARTGARFLSSQGLPSPSLQRTFACGHMWHGYLQAMLIEMGFVEPENVEHRITKKIVSDEGIEVVCSGTIDLLDVHIPGYGDWLVDMKTVNKREFELGILEFTMAKWQAQINCYGDWAGREKMMVLAIEKDSPHRFLEFQIQRDEKLLEEIYGRWFYTEHHIKEGTPPVCEHGYGAPCDLESLCSYYVVPDDEDSGV